MNIDKNTTKHNKNDPASRWDEIGINVAYEEALIGYKENGVPIGGCLIDSRDGKILGRGHNLRFQKGSATLHGEIATLENAGRLPASTYRHTTIYTTLSPCDMCTGAIIMYGIPRCVIGENDTLKSPGEAYIKARGQQVIVINDDRCKQLMKKFIAERPEDWAEDCGE